MSGDDERADNVRHEVACGACRRQPRPDPSARRAREQLEGRRRRDPEAPADGVHRRLRIGEELARFRHDRRLRQDPGPSVRLCRCHSIAIHLPRSVHPHLNLLFDRRVPTPLHGEPAGRLRHIACIQIDRNVRELTRDVELHQRDVEILVYRRRSTERDETRNLEPFEVERRGVELGSVEPVAHDEGVRDLDGS